MTGGGAPADAATLEALRRADAMQPLPEAVAVAAHAAAARFGDAVESVIFYGSVLRDGEFSDRILDFYVVVKSYRQAHGSLLSAAANRILPPNVYYVEADLPSGGKVRAKVAVISRRHLEALTGSGTFNSTLWARFAQPVRIAMAVDAAADRAACALAQSVRTLARSVIPLLPAEFSSRDFWNMAFANTYRAELRAERHGKGGEIYDLNKEYFDNIFRLLSVEIHLTYEGGCYRHDVASGAPAVTRVAWAFRRVQGKALTLLRLVKAAFTFDGGADYLAWKISRHSGVVIHLTPWQRRHPVLGGVSLFVRLWRQRAFR